MKRLLFLALFILAALSFAKFPQTTANDKIHRLSEIANSDPNYKVRLQAIVTMVELKDTRFLKPLKRAFKDKNPLVRAIAGIAFKELCKGPNQTAETSCSTNLPNQGS